MFRTGTLHSRVLSDEVGLAPATTGRRVRPVLATLFNLSGGGGQIVTTATKVVIKPLEDRIVVKPLEAEQTTASGLVIPDTAKEKPQEGEVMAVGPGRWDEAGSKRIPVDVKVGNVVLYSKYGGTEVKYSGEEYLVLSSRDVLAVIEK
jgi:chaperonin GroES